MKRPKIQSWLCPVAMALTFCYAPQVFAQNPAASVTVDANLNRHPISPNIYGVAYASTSDLAATNFTVNRSGGNSASRYNWQILATNHACDWYFESILDDPSSPTSGDGFVNLTRAANVGAQPLITIPMLGYVAKLGSNSSILPSFSIAKYGAQTGWDPYLPDAGNGNRVPGNQSTCGPDNPIAGNNPLDAHVANSASFQQSWIQHLVGAFGAAANGGIKYYIMDNEPSLWNSTHRDVHPNPQTYDEIYNLYLTYAGAVRASEPNALIVGPEEWSWWAMFLSSFDQKNGLSAAGSDYSTHNNTYYYPWLLQQLYNYKQTTGKQLLNVLSVHYYPQDASGGGDDSLATQLVRNQSTRSLWDPTYVDQSWFNQVGINNGIVNLIPTLKSWVSQYYPGLQTAITEYNWGDEAKLNGATTQADALGIFGREGLDIATRWTVPANPSPTYLSLEMYRNYDGNRSVFGDTSVSASVANPDNLSSFAAVRTSDGALTVMVINKQQRSTPVTISLANFGTTGTAEAYQISSATQSSITHLANLTVSGNAVSATAPSQSITLLVIPAGSVVSPPTAPTGLAATVASGTVTLTWNAAGGATSYTVKRGTVSGGPYTSIGAVPDTAALTLTDSGLTNGTTYYYVVSGTNSAGPGPNSAELAATPMVPPTFTSSASASPNPVTQGNNTNISATVTCTSNGLSNGNIQILILDPNGQTAATQNFTGQNFNANQSHNYSTVLTPALAGTYTVEVGVFSATWQLWNWNASAATVTSKSAIVFTTSATAPSTVAIGAGAPISLTVNQTGTGTLTNGNVELQIFNAAGTAVATQVWSGQNFAAGQTLQYSYTWTPSASLAPGAYTVDVGVFDGGWSTDYYWNTDATITVTAAQTGITIQTSPAGLQFTVDGGAAQTAPQTLNLSQGPHTIAVATTQAGPAGTQYVFTGWSDNGAASHSITVGSTGAIYTASFKTQYQLTISASPAAGGSVTPATGGYYDSGSSVPISATPASGYSFSVWTGSVAAASSAATSVTMNAPETVVANFLTVTAVTIHTSPTGLQFSIDSGLAQTAPQTVNLSQGPHTIAVATPQAGPAGTQYVFNGWSDGGAASHSITVGSTAATYTASFKTQYQLTISASPAAGGIVTPASGGYYDAGLAVNTTAAPNANYTFSGWTGSVAVALSASTTVTMSAPETVVANFTVPTTAGLRFVPATPCRVMDTRNANGTFGGPIIPAGGTRNVPIPQSACNIPTTAQAYSLNITVVPPGPLGYLSVWPAGQAQPLVSTLNSMDGRVVANAAIVPAGGNGAISVFVSDASHAIVDINGYFAAASGAPSGPGSLAFYSLTPCRIVDTRNANSPFGGPSLGGGSTRSFAIPSSACGVPSTVQAYSLNFTVVPHGPLGYLATWPTGQIQPLVSTLNSFDGSVVANAAIVPAGTNSAINVFATDATDVVIDINGYFAPPGSAGALSLYVLAPCRVVDTRNAAGTFGGPILSGGATRSFPIPSSACSAPATAQAYSFNVTVVPPGPLGYLTAWPTGQTQPLVSTLNSMAGKVVANAAIVPAGSGPGAVSFFVSDPSHLVLDINAYFAQ